VALRYVAVDFGPETYDTNHKASTFVSVVKSNASYETSATPAFLIERNTVEAYGWLSSASPSALSCIHTSRHLVRSVRSSLETL
jgi:hypothetical protein